MKHYLFKPYLAQLYSPLIKRIDSPNETLYSNSVFIDCQQLRNIEHQEIMTNKVIMTNYVEYTTRLWNQRRTYATFIFYQELKTKTEGLEKTQ